MNAFPLKNGFSLSSSSMPSLFILFHYIVCVLASYWRWQKIFFLFISNQRKALQWDKRNENGEISISFFEMSIIAITRERLSLKVEMKLMTKMETFHLLLPFQWAFFILIDEWVCFSIWRPSQPYYQHENH